MRKRQLFDVNQLEQDLIKAKKTGDTVLRVKTENRIKLNEIQPFNKKYDIITLNYAISQLKKFNKDTRSYGINTGIEIAIDILEEIKERGNDRGTRANNSKM